MLGAMSRRPRSAWRGFWLVTMLAGSVFAMGRVGRAAEAQDAEEPIRLDYQSGPGCPDEASFVARIRARTRRARLVAEGEPAREFHVRLAGASRPAGSVTVVNHGHAEGVRRVDAGTCDEVADALSLIIVLALDPRALEAAPPPTASSAPAPASPVGAGVPAGPLVAPAPAPSTPVAPAPPAPSAPPPPPPPAPAPPAPPPPPPSGAQGPPPAGTTAHDVAVSRGPGPLGLHFFGGADLAVATGVAPGTLLGGSPYLGWRSTAAALVGLSIRAAFLRIGTEPQAASQAAIGSTATFTWTVGRVDACGLVWPDRPLRVGGCARVEAGVLGATGAGIAGGRTQHGPWITAGALARIEWTFLGPLVLDLEAGPTFRPFPDRVAFAFPDRTVYQVPVVGLDAEVGLGVHFL
jgi:hypothetical protein